MSDPLAKVRPFASQLMRRLRASRRPNTRRVAAVGDIGPETISPETAFTFHCNLCGAPNGTSLLRLSRETPSCAGCGSNVRFRAMARLVVREMLGRDVALPDAPRRPDIVGLGLSDVAAYAGPLAEVFAYENTWYHTTPQLDIANTPPERLGRYDFVVASDVFEHVAPPASRAFENARKLLKPGGRLIFTVPFSLDPDTVEHFPDLHEWRVAEHDGGWRLTNRTAAGALQTFDDLIFHGGPGTTLEMRLFSKAALEREFLRAGFARVRVAAEPYLPFGIHWPEPYSVPMVAYAP